MSKAAVWPSATLPRICPRVSEAELVHVDDGMSDEERAALDESLADSIEQMKKGLLIAAHVALAEIRSRK